MRRVASGFVGLLVAASTLQAQQAIRPGARVNGSLASGDATLQSGEFQDTYTLQGRAGQRLVIRLSSAAFDPYLIMRGPADFSQDNDDEASGNTSSRLDVRLPADGTYRILATSFRPGETGAYTLEVTEGAGAPAPVAAGQEGAQGGGALAPGQTVRGALAQGDRTLTSGEFQDTWTLNGRQGQQFEVRLTAADFDPYLLVRGPNSFSADNDDDDTERGSRNSRLLIRLPADGEYRIIATSYRSGESGSYSLSLREASQAAAPVPASAPLAARGTIAIGQTQNGRLERGDQQLPAGEFADSYSLSGTRGQRIDIRLEGTGFDPYVAISGPNSFSAYNDDDMDATTTTTNSHLVVTLPADGAYQIVATSFRSGETGSYRLSVASTTTVTAGAGASIAAQPVSIGRATPGTLAAGDDTLQTGEFVDRYTFTGQRGQRVAVDMTSTAFDTYVQLVAPSGRQEENDDAAQGSTNSRIETVLTEDGAYTVLATSFERAMTGAYQVTIGGLNTGARQSAVAQGAPAQAAPAGSGLTPGTAVNGQLAQGDPTLPSGEFLDRYSFTGRRGQVVTVEMQSTAMDPYLIVSAPSGAQQENDDATTGERNSRVTWVLPEDGAYTVMATSYRPGETGAYAVRLALGAGQIAANPAPVPGPTPGRPGGARAGQRIWTVSVGISNYGGQASDLPYTAEDAIKINQSLQRAGVLAEGSVVLTDGEATYERVRAAFTQVARQAGPDDVFMFFYSGHGTQLRPNAQSNEPDQRDEAIVLRDRVVTDDEMAQWFTQVRSRMAIIALDACFSGGFARDVVNRPGVMGLFSSEEDLTSAVAGKFQAGGYLAHFLRTGLAGDADGDSNRDVTAGELSTYLRRQFATQAQDVEAVTTERQRNYQFLVIDRGGVKIDDIVLLLGG